ncbi:hypothetical protein [Pedobacter steynii]
MLYLIQPKDLILTTLFNSNVKNIQNFCRDPYILFFLQTVQAQSVKITGTVTGNPDGETIPGASIIIKGKKAAQLQMVTVSFLLLQMLMMCLVYLIWDMLQKK